MENLEISNYVIKLSKIIFYPFGDEDFNWSEEYSKPDLETIKKNLTEQNDSFKKVKMYLIYALYRFRNNIDYTNEGNIYHKTVIIENKISECNSLIKMFELIDDIIVLFNILNNQCINNWANKYYFTSKHDLLLD